MADALYVIVGIVVTLWDRLTRISPIEWIAFCATFSTLALVFIAVHTARIQELMDGPTGVDTANAAMPRRNTGASSTEPAIAVPVGDSTSDTASRLIRLTRQCASGGKRRPEES